MNNTTLLLEALALTKDAYDRLGGIHFDDISEAEDTLRIAKVRFWLASAHRQIGELLHDRAGRKTCEP